MKRTTRQWTLISLLAVCCLLISAMGAQAQDEIAAAGNGGTGDAWANGGAAALGDINSGGNLGNALGLGDTGGGEISGGSVANSTTGDIGVDGGTGIADASGGEDNIAFTLDPVPPAPDPVPPAPPAPLPPAPTPEPVPPPVPQVCVTSLLGTSCTTVIECSAPGPGQTCAIPDCNNAIGLLPGLPPVPCIGGECVQGPNATTNCVLV